MDDFWAAAEEKDSIVEKTRSGFSRSCLEEKETKLFIGREKSCLKKKKYSVKGWENFLNQNHVRKENTLNIK